MDKTQTQTEIKLPSQKSIFVITGHSGTYEDKSSWIVCAYSEKEYANKAVRFLDKLASKLSGYRNEEYCAEFARDLEELKLHDPKAWFNDFIVYNVEEVKVVV